MLYESTSTCPDCKGESMAWAFSEELGQIFFCKACERAHYKVDYRKVVKIDVDTTKPKTEKKKASKKKKKE